MKVYTALLSRSYILQEFQSEVNKISQIYKSKPLCYKLEGMNFIYNDTRNNA